jgi:hypothetical protein
MAGPHSVAGAAVKGLIFFFRASWSYLGCNGGTGRWRARRTYFRKGISTYLIFRRLRKQDKVNS